MKDWVKWLLYHQASISSSHKQKEQPLSVWLASGPGLSLQARAAVAREAGRPQLCDGGGAVSQPLPRAQNKAPSTLGRDP